MGYDLPGPWPGMFTHHSASCPARLGQPCSCGPRGYRGSIENGHKQAPVLGPVVWTMDEARSWQQEQQTATHAFEAAAQPMDGHAAPAPAPAPAPGPGPAPQPDSQTVWAARPVETHGYQATPEPDTVAAVVNEFLEAARAGDATDARGRPYDDEQFADLRWSLRGYVTSDLGAMPIADLNAAELRAFVGHLDEAGLALSRTRSVIRALRSLLRYAAERGLVPWTAPDLLVFGDGDDAPAPAPREVPPATVTVPAAAPAQAPAASGFVSDEVIWLILKIVTLVFALIALVLVAESV